MLLLKDYSGIMTEKIKYVHYYFLYESLNGMITFLINSRHIKEVLMKKTYLYKQILQYVNDNRKEIFKDHPVIVIYYYIVQMYLEFDDRYYEELNRYCLAKKKNFSFELLREYHLCCEIYFHMKILAISGDEFRNRKELFKIDKIAFEKDQYYEKYFSKGRFMEGYKFIYTVKNALSVNEINWSRKIVEKFPSIVIPVQREIIYDVSRAIISLIRKDYDMTLNYLANVSLKHLIYYAEAKLLRMMVWIETNYTELHKNEQSSFKKSLLKNPDIDNDVKDHLKILLNYLNSIFKLKIKKDRNIKNEVRNLRNKLKKEQYLFD